MWGVLLAACVAAHGALPHGCVHLTHACWYAVRGCVEPPPPTVRFGDAVLVRRTTWQVLAFACASTAYALPRPSLLDYAWIPLVVFCGMGYRLPLWTMVLQTSFFVGHVRLRPEVALVLTTLLWKHVHMSRRALWVAAAAHACLAWFEPVGDWRYAFVSIVAAECKYRMRLDQVFWFWCASLGGMLYDRRWVVWTLPALASLALGNWVHRWRFTDKVWNGNAIYLGCSLLLSRAF